jgi:hypothetical protein
LKGLSWNNSWESATIKHFKNKSTKKYKQHGVGYTSCLLAVTTWWRHSLELSIYQLLSNSSLFTSSSTSCNAIYVFNHELSLFIRIFANLEVFVRRFRRYGTCLCHLCRSSRRSGQLGLRRPGLMFAIVCGSWACGARVVYSARVVRTELFVDEAGGLTRSCAKPRLWPLLPHQLYIAPSFASCSWRHCRYCNKSFPYILFT